MEQKIQEGERRRVDRLFYWFQHFPIVSHRNPLVENNEQVVVREHNSHFATVTIKVWVILGK